MQGQAWTRCLSSSRNARTGRKCAGRGSCAARTAVLAALPSRYPSARPRARCGPGSQHYCAVCAQNSKPHLCSVKNQKLSAGSGAAGAPRFRISYRITFAERLEDCAPTPVPFKARVALFRYHTVQAKNTSSQRPPALELVLFPPKGALKHRAHPCRSRAIPRAASAALRGPALRLLTCCRCVCMLAAAPGPPGAPDPPAGRAPVSSPAGPGVY